MVQRILSYLQEATSFMLQTKQKHNNRYEYWILPMSVNTHTLIGSKKEIMCVWLEEKHGIVLQSRRKGNVIMKSRTWDIQRVETQQ